MNMLEKIMQYDFADFKGRIEDFCENYEVEIDVNQLLSSYDERYSGITIDFINFCDICSSVIAFSNIEFHEYVPKITDYLDIICSVVFDSIDDRFYRLIMELIKTK